MYRSGHSKSGLFLMELIIVILFFSLASTVCIQMFAKSHLISEETVNKNEAVLAAQNLAESWYAAGGDLTAMSAVFPDASVTDDRLVLSYDSSWNLCDDASAVYTAVLTNSSEDADNITCSILVGSANGTEEDALYTLSLRHHIPATLP